MGLENILVSNVRGLNGLTHHDAPQELVIVERLSIACLQVGMSILPVGADIQ
jgi:hypothetical protein